MRTSRWFAASLVALASLLVPPGCKGGDDTKSSSGAASAATPESPLEFKPGQGRKTTLESLDPSRIVSIGGALTETVFALGHGGRVVAVDRTSIYPAEVSKLPNVGLYRAVNPEGVAAQKPTLVIATEATGPPGIFDQLKEAGLDVLVVDETATAQAAASRIKALGKALGKAAEGDTLASAVTTRIDAVKGRIKGVKAIPKVLFIYARGHKTLLVAGEDTPAASVIALAGGKSAVAGVKGFKPLTAESVVSAAPEVILVPARSIASLKGVEGVLALPGVDKTPAGKNKKVVGIDDLALLGFGPRLGEAVDTLAKALHPEAAAK